MLRHFDIKPLGWVMCVVLPVVVAASGCGSDQPLAAYYGHYHRADWISVHPGSAISSTRDCMTCHAMTVLRQGGPAPSCMTAQCHHVSVAGWKDAPVHGTRAKGLLGTTGGSFTSCLTCHGPDFKGDGSGVSCASCHGVQAPHPPKPWLGSTGFTHTTTSSSNAAVCATCHFPGSPNNPPRHPGTPAPTGTAPGCFNNTLCHGDGSAPHLLGSIWLGDANPSPPSAQFHGLEAKQDLGYCQSCHGVPQTPRFEGGAAPTACSTCHTDAKAHSMPWHAAPVTAFPAYTPSHRNAGHKEAACSICHDVTMGRIPPVPSAPSCYSATFSGASCHADGPGEADHLIPFLGANHLSVTSNTFAASCGSCHAATGTSPVTAAPTCVVCHQANSPLQQPTGCRSCHAKPPSGTVFPDRAGSHGTHQALAGVADVCSSCHQGYDSNTLAHYAHANARPGNNSLRVPPAPTAFLPAYNGRTGSAAFSATSLACSNVSCHGAITTPNWRTGTLDSATACEQCHTLGTSAGSPQHNSPYSGEHDRHMGLSNVACTTCHAMSNGSDGAVNHFRFLSTPQMEGPASSTIRLPSGTYNVADQTCTLVCHGEDHQNQDWP